MIKNKMKESDRMKQELVRIYSKDEIELPGILYAPSKKTNKIVIHVHGINGNFYENHFLDILAKTYTKEGYAFLTFNNRGNGYISELKKKNSTVLIGGCNERFIDCILDLDGVMDWVKKKGYHEVILEGHSYGCNKVLYYYNQKEPKEVKKIVLLAPCDVPGSCMKLVNKKIYDKLEKEATIAVKNKEEKYLECPVMANGRISASTLYYDLLPDGENDFIRYRDQRNTLLNEIEIPVLVVFGDIDRMVLSEPKEVVVNYLEKNLPISNIQVISGATHSFKGKEMELANVIEQNLT